MEDKFTESSMPLLGSCDLPSSRESRELFPLPQVLFWPCIPSHLLRYPSYLLQAADYLGLCPGPAHQESQVVIFWGAGGRQVGDILEPLGKGAGFCIFARARECMCTQVFIGCSWRNGIILILGSRLLKNHAISKIKTRQGLLYFLGLSFAFIVGLVWPWAHSFL